MSGRIEGHDAYRLGKVAKREYAATAVLLLRTCIQVETRYQTPKAAQLLYAPCRFFRNMA